jgi:threonine dehydrogenase-like Zn-dependent dehydrogenase
VYVATRGESHRRLADELGAAWTGDALDTPPVALDAAIVFAPAGEIVPGALRALRAGGTLVLAGIHMSDIPALSYDACLFHEKTLTSVESNTRADGEDLLREADAIGLRPRTTPFPLDGCERRARRARRGPRRRSRGSDRVTLGRRDLRWYPVASIASHHVPRRTMEPRTALVTGANGEMGHLLLPSLRARGYDVVAVDVRPLAPEIASSCRAIAIGSVVDGPLMTELFREHEPDAVFHLAALLSSRAESDPDLAHDVNVSATLNLFRLCRERARTSGQDIRFLFPSSIACTDSRMLRRKPPRAASRKRSGTGRRASTAATSCTAR